MALCLVSTMGLFRIINMRSLIFVKNVEFLRQGRLKCIFFLPSMKICLNFNGSQPIYTYKLCAYKRVYILFPC